MTRHLHKTIFLIPLYFIIQMTGQIGAKFAAGCDSLINPFTLISYLCLLSRGFIWVLILSRMRVIAAYPLNGISYLLILPLSFFIFSEPISRVRLISTLLISAGVALLSYGEKRTGGILDG